jgi:hypothetical protein
MRYLPRAGGRRSVILADTSAWVEFDRATGGDVDRRLTEIITTSEPLGVTQPVIMELTAVARNDEREQDIRGSWGALICSTSMPSSTSMQLPGSTGRVDEPELLHEGWSTA